MICADSHLAEALVIERLAGRIRQRYRHGRQLLMVGALRFDSGQEGSKSQLEVQSERQSVF
jgi:hypothetical protein